MHAQNVGLWTRTIPYRKSLALCPADIRPRIAEDAPTEILQTHVLSSKFGKFTDINNRTVNGFVSPLSGSQNPRRS